MQKSILPMLGNNLYRVIYSPRRKRIALRLAADGVLEVLSPDKFPEHLLRKLVMDNQHLIGRLRKAPRKNLPDLTEGNTFMLRGAPYPLRFTHRLRIFDNAFLIPKGNFEEIKNSMTTLYRELAIAIIRKRILPFQEAIGETPAKIRISGADTRWGSCSGNRTISFSWKLIQCPVETVDYVIVHELSHLKEMNHSQKFWRVVAEVLPDYQKRKRQLNEFSRQLPFWE